VRLTKEEEEVIMLRKENCGRQISVVGQLSSRSARCKQCQPVQKQEASACWKDGAHIPTHASGALSVRLYAIKDGACSTEAIGARLNAGTNCGSCLPELKRMLAAAPAQGGADIKLPLGPNWATHPPLAGSRS
jgi:bacterioferritin-associated ferredoxin